MSRLNSALSIALFCCTVLCARPSSAQMFNPALEFSSGLPVIFAAPDTYTVGWGFTVNQGITVTSLAAFDYPSQAPQQVRLYSLNNPGAVLVSANLSLSDSTIGSPGVFFTQAVSPTVLTPGAYGIVEDILPNNTVANINVGGITTFSAITYTGGLSAIGTGHDPTTNVYPGSYNPDFIGPDFGGFVTPAAPATPEPAVLALYAIGCATCALALRRKHSVKPGCSAHPTSD